MAFASVFLASFALYLSTLCPTVTSGDTGEMIQSAFLLDVSHPPGYGLFALLMRLAMEIPAGGPMFRAGLVSSFAGASACAFLFSVAGKLGASRLVALAGAAALAVQPYVWWQSTMAEKYALQMALALFVIDCAFGRRWLLAAFAFGVALAHHPQAVLLTPVLFRTGLKEATSRPPAIRASLCALTLFVMLLPLSLRVLYPAVRADSIARAEANPFAEDAEPAANWGEPSRARTLFDYLTLDYYSVYLGGETRLERSSFGEHLGHYPAQLTWPGLFLALTGFWFLFRRHRGTATAMAAVAGLVFVFSARFPLPPSLSVSYHQNALIVFSLAACAGLEGLLVRWAGGKRARSLVVSACLLAAAGRASSLYRVHDASRHFFYHDFNISVVRLAPPKAVLMSAYEYDCFTLTCFQRALGLRPDLVSLLIPQKTKPDHFAVRKLYRPYAAARMPEAVLNFTEDDPGPYITRRMLLDNSPAFCFAFNGLSDPVVPHDLVVNRAAIYLPREGACRDPGLKRAWRAVSARSWFSAGRAILVNLTVIDFTAQMLLSSAMESSRDPEGQVRLLKTMARLDPAQPAAWLALSRAQQAAGRTTDAFNCVRRAIELSPLACDGHLALIRLMISSGAHSAAATHLEDLLSISPYREAAAADSARRLLSLASLNAALPSVWRVFAETALNESLALPDNPELIRRKIYLARLAADLVPDWAPAQLECADLLLRRGRYAEASTYIARFVRLAPDSPESESLRLFLETEAPG